MSIKIRVSYETDAEINRIIDLLTPLGLKVKTPVKKGERFFRTYMYDRNNAPYYGERNKDRLEEST